ncbi:hypothetical protein [Thalassobacillus sp. CUG 92003]|uniref:hypothetical protein n=1 Tax=Thalassobacillus sp. CUG 92003 TaxID=2736641 RepID=UPI0015E6BDEC|nr:hypothetical protein [Thalassobacillus sp. CUG 92003]
MDGIISIVVIVLIVFGFTRLLGYKKGNIIVDLDQRFKTFNREYVQAITHALEKQGLTVDYLGDRYFEIDGKTYLYTELNWGFLQRSILKPRKQSG